MNAIAIIIEEVQDRGRRRAPRQFGREGAPMLCDVSFLIHPLND